MCYGTGDWTLKANVHVSIKVAYTWIKVVSASQLRVTNIIIFAFKYARSLHSLLLSCTVCACTDTTGEPLKLDPSRRPHANTDSCRHDPTITMDGNVLAPLKPQYCRTLETGMTVSKPLTSSDHTWAIISCCRAHFYALQVRIRTI